MNVMKLVRRKQGALAVAGTAIGALASASNAAVVFTPASTVVSSAGTSSIGVDVNNDSVNDFTITASTSSGIQVTKDLSVDADSVPKNDNGIVTDISNGDVFVGHALALNFGDTIGSSSNISTSADIISADGNTGNFTVGAGAKYLGVAIMPLNDGPPDPANTNYGYIKFQTLSTGAVVSGEVLGYGYDTTLTNSITAGATPVPEPAALSMLALGAAGVLAYRRRGR